jgi:hypothetical protein
MDSSHNHSTTLDRLLRFVHQQLQQALGDSMLFVQVKAMFPKQAMGCAKEACMQSWVQRVMCQ